MAKETKNTKREKASTEKVEKQKIKETKEKAAKVEYRKVCMNLPAADVALMQKTTGNDNISEMLRNIFGEYVKVHVEG